MAQKRYAIVRVDNTWCPNKFENINNDFVCTNDYNSPFQKWHCKDCRYGDTKEQLIKKVAQIIFKTKVERYRRVWKCDCSEMEKRDRYKDSLVLARKIIEFLGVE